MVLKKKNMKTKPKGSKCEKCGFIHLKKDKCPK